MGPWAALLALLLLPAAARAAASTGAPACAAEVARWGSGCPRARGLEVQAAFCPAGRMVLSIRSAGGAPIPVEVGPPAPGSFRVAGGLGLAPIGEIADWSQAPAAHRRALDDLAGCLEQDPTLALPPAVADRGAPAGGAAAPRPLPVALLLGAMAAGVAWALRRRRAPMAGARSSWVPPAALFAAALAFRWIALPRAFFHQNGHGPAWIAYALGSHDLSSYGPGYAEVLGAVARLAPARPEGAVFLAQALAGALIPALAWSIARRAGAGRALSLALAAPLVVDPALGRLAQGESYFNVCAALLFAAAAALAAGAHRGGLRRPGFWVAALAAGLLVAQAARVHPLCWVPAATLPAVALAQRGRLRRRLALAAASGLVLGGAVAAAALPAMLAVVEGPLGRQWMGEVAVRIDLPALIAAAAAAALARRAGRGAAIAVATGGACLLVTLAANRVRADSAWVSAGYLRLGLPALVACGAAALSRLRLPPRRRLALAGAVALAGAAHAAWIWRPVTALPTDALEAAWALGWRERLPAGATVVYLARAERRAATLPLYRPAGGAAPGGPSPGALDREALGRAHARGPAAYYVRSSLCSTDEGREACAAFERRHALRLVEERELPARDSLPWLPMPPGPIRVALYEVE